MNYGLREIDTSFKNMLKEIYEGYTIVHYNPDIDWVKETYPCVAFKTEQNANTSYKDYNSYDIDDQYITDKPDYTQMLLTLYILAKTQQDINVMIEKWLDAQGTYASTMDITGKDGNVKTVFMERKTAFVTSDEKLNGKTYYRRVLQFTIDVPVELPSREYNKVERVIVTKKEVRNG